MGAKAFRMPIGSWQAQYIAVLHYSLVSVGCWRPFNLGLVSLIIVPGYWEFSATALREENSSPLSPNVVIENDANCACQGEGESQAVII